MHIGICYRRARRVADELNGIVVRRVEIRNGRVKAMMEVMRSEREWSDSWEICKRTIVGEEGYPSFDRNGK